MNLEEGQLTIGGEEDLPSKGVSVISNILNKNRYLQKHNEILISTWQGLNLKQRIEDVDVNKNYFQWLKRWQTCPTDAVHEVFLVILSAVENKVLR